MGKFKISENLRKPAVFPLLFATGAALGPVRLRLFNDQCHLKTVCTLLGGYFVYASHRCLLHKTPTQTNFASLQHRHPLYLGACLALCGLASVNDMLGVCMSVFKLLNCRGFRRFASRDCISSAGPEIAALQASSLVRFSYSNRNLFSVNHWPMKSA